jgi:hypothetical protein
MDHDDTTRTNESPDKGVKQKEVPPPAKKVGDETANPLPSKNTTEGGDPGRSA